jgi:hypothetical protein
MILVSIRPTRAGTLLLVALVLIVAGGVIVNAQEPSVLASFELGDSVSPPVAGTADIAGAADLAGPDWSDLFNADGTPRDEIDENGQPPGNGVPDYVDLYGGRAAVFVADDVSNGGALDFTTRRGKDKLGNGVVPPEEDLGNAYVYVTTDEGGRVMLYAGIERIATRPASLEIELNQTIVRPGHGFPEAGGWEIVRSRTADDLKLQIIYGNGARLDSLSLERWADSDSDGRFSWESVLQLEEEGCDDGESLCVFLNAGTISGGAWPSFDSSGAVVAELSRRHFTELGLDVSSLTGRESGAPGYRSVQLRTPSDLALGHFDTEGGR